MHMCAHNPVGMDEFLLAEKLCTSPHLEASFKLARKVGSKMTQRPSAALLVPFPLEIHSKKEEATTLGPSPPHPAVRQDGPRLRRGASLLFRKSHAALGLGTPVWEWPRQVRRPKETNVADSTLDAGKWRSHVCRVKQVFNYCKKNCRVDSVPFDCQTSGVPA